MLMLKPPLVLESVEKWFGDTAILRGVSATIAAASITAFIGPNGAGKTTLFHCISGDLRPDRGRILFRGESVTRMPPWKIARRGLGKMFQDVRIFPSLSVLDNVLLALHAPAEQTVLGSLLRT